MKKTPSSPKMPVSDLTLRKSSLRLLGQSLVSTEVQYVQRTLGNTATQQQIDDSVLAVRKLPWASIVEPD